MVLGGGRFLTGEVTLYLLNGQGGMFDPPLVLSSYVRLAVGAHWLLAI